MEKNHNFFANSLLVHNCAEIIEYSDPSQNKIATCNLASISLPACVVGKKGKRTFDFQKLAQITGALTENLNRIIDTGFYPVEGAKVSNMSERPIGIGIQGLADVFALMKIKWESEEAMELNRKIAESMYYGFLDKSCDLAKIHGTYATYDGCPISRGEFQFDSWEVTPSSLWDWTKLKEKIAQHGIRNSLGISGQPTASTSQILGNCEQSEPFSSNIYKRTTLSGEFVQVNKYLVEDLLELGLWNDSMRQQIIAANGSVQNITSIPQDLKDLYKTIWEISQKTIIDMAGIKGRGPYVCHSQSTNLHIANVNVAKVSSALMYSWKVAKNKTLVYYLRTQPNNDGMKITVDKSVMDESKKLAEEAEEGMACSLDDPGSCEMCSS